MFTRNGDKRGNKVKYREFDTHFAVLYLANVL